MSDEIDVEAVDDALGVDTLAVQRVANGTKDELVRLAEEEGLDVREMLWAINAVSSHVEDAVVESLGDGE